MAPKKAPSVIQVAGSERYEICVLKVLTRGDDGSPRTFELLRDDESTRVDGGEVFYTVYAHPTMKSRPS